MEASSLTNKKKHQLLQFNYTILWISNSIELHRLRVCTHTNIFLRIPRRWCGPWPHRIPGILKTSSRTSLRMNGRACTPRAEFSDPESTALPDFQMLYMFLREELVTLSIMLQVVKSTSNYDSCVDRRAEAHSTQHTNKQTIEMMECP